MPIQYPGTVADWDEIVPTGAGHVQQLHQALGFLMEAFPGRYEKYSINALKKQMNFRDLNNELVPGLRVWMHKVSGKMSAFFFLRAKHTPQKQAYCMSVGLAASFTDSDKIYKALQPLCKFMVGETPGRIEIMNDLDTPAKNNAVLTYILEHQAAGNLAAKEVIDPGDGWPKPKQVNSWKINP